MRLPLPLLLSASLLLAAVACGSDDDDLRGTSAGTGNAGASVGGAASGRAGRGDSARGGAISSSGGAGRGQAAQGGHGQAGPARAGGGSRATSGGRSGSGAQAGTRNAGGGVSAQSGAGATSGNAEAGESGGGQAGATNTGNAGQSGASAGPERVYVSTYLNGLHALALDLDAGLLSEPAGAPVDTGAHLYALTADPRGHFVVSANLDAKVLKLYAVGADGTLPTEPTESVTLDDEPITVAFAPSGAFLYVGTTSDDAIRTFGVNPSTGALTLVGEPFVLPSPPAYIAADPLGRFVYVTADGIHGFSVGATGVLTELDESPFGLSPPAFAGALALRPDGAFLYTSGSALSAFAVGANGKLSELPDSPFSADVASDVFAGDIAVDPQGRYLYVTSFATQDLSGFAIDPVSGALDAVPASPRRTSAPYSVAVDATGSAIFVGNDDGTIAVFSLDRDNGSFAELPASPFSGLGGLQPQFAVVGHRRR